MRLRQRLQSELAARMATHLPEAMVTIWDHQAVVIAIEALKFKPAGGAMGGWQNLAHFEGVVRAELRADGADDLPVEGLIADLIQQNLFLNEDGDTPEGGITETARAALIEMRDTIRDTQVVTLLRLDVSGLIVRRASDPARPALLVSEAPLIGAAHSGDYQHPEDRT